MRLWIKSNDLLPQMQRDACYIDSGHCLFAYNTEAPPRGQFLHYIPLSIVTETFGINFWLKLLVSRFDWNFW